MKKNNQTPARYGAQAANMRRRLLPVLVAACFNSSAALANPSGAQIVNGQAAFSSQGNILTITNTPGTIINWQSFGINAGEVTRFVQQNAGSSVLNRVVGQDPSKILGALQSNGRVFLINPNGVVFGKGAQVDVNGLVASSLDISNEDFLAGNMNFRIGDKAGKLRNQGRITTPHGGQVYLIAPDVENSGIITSPQGDVMLAAGHAVKLVDSANPDLHVVVSARDNQALNIGRIVAQGGKTGIYGALVKQRGIINANSAVVGENGKIVLKASRDIDVAAGSMTSANGIEGGSVTLQSDGTTLVQGRVEAKGEDGKGGQISMLGQRVGLDGPAVLDVSGKTGGGTVLVGGDYQGKGTAPNASVTYTGEQASIKADATENGDGGKVVVWADHTTRSYAQISARGGARGGNGGLVETSGKKYLDVGASFPDVRAPRGVSGTWLLDPENILIAPAASTPVAGLSWELAADGTTMLNSAVLIGYLQSQGSAIVSTSGNGTGNGNITLADGLDAALTSDATLTLRAHNDIALNNRINASGGKLDLILDADQDGNGAGGVYLNRGMSLNGGDASISGNFIRFAALSTLDASKVDLRADKLTVDGTITASNASIRPYTPGRAITVGSADCHASPCLAISNLHRIEASVIGIGDNDETPAGPIYVAGITNSGKSAASDRSSLTTRIGLLSGSDVTQGGAIDVEDLGVIAGGAVRLDNPGNAVTNLAGTAGAGGFAFVNKKTMTAATLHGDDYAVNGITSDGGNISLSTVGTGDLNLNAAINAGTGDVDIKAAGSITSLAMVSGNRLNAEATNGILLMSEVNALGAVNNDKTGNSEIILMNHGDLTLHGVRQKGGAGDITIYSYGDDSFSNYRNDTANVAEGGSIRLASGIDAGAGSVSLMTGGAISGSGVLVKGDHLTALAGKGMSLSTSVASLSVMNIDETGSSDIRVANTGEMTLYMASQLGTGAGNISITNQGAFTVAAGQSVTTETGNISLTAHSPLTIEGNVASGSGNISLEAGASHSGNDVLTISGRVSTTGSVGLKAGDAIRITGTVESPAITRGGNVNGGPRPTPQPLPDSGQPPGHDAAPVINVRKMVDTANDSLLAWFDPASAIVNGNKGSAGHEPAPEEAKAENGKAAAAQENNGARKNEAAKKLVCN